MIAGTQDNGTLRHRGDGIWDQIAGGDGGDCAVNAASPDTCYHSFYYMAIERSRSSGDGWTDITPEVASRLSRCLVSTAGGERGLGRACRRDRAGLR